MSDGAVSVLADALALLGDDASVRIAEFGLAGLVLWEVRRDVVGTPRCTFRPPVPWTVPNDQLTQIIRAGVDLLICSSPDNPLASAAFASFRDRADAYTTTDPLDELLRGAIARDLIIYPYQLVVLRLTPAGGLLLGTLDLFGPGARRGDRRSIMVRCESAHEDGTVFAVVAVRPPDRFILVSVQSVDVPPGTYTLTAELARPGVVRFEGLPAGLQSDSRPWAAIVASVPAQLDFQRPPRSAHLICAVEVSGESALVEQRLQACETLIRTVAKEVGERLSISMIAYGPHSFDRAVPDPEPTVLTWAATSDRALRRLRGQAASDVGYPRAAQLECVLTFVAHRLDDQEGRPVFVAVGSRPAFPPQQDLASEIVPCPYRHDWQRAIARLAQQFSGISFGAIHDAEPPEGIWARLAASSIERPDARDFRNFAVELRLLGPKRQDSAVRLGLLGAKGQDVPFPLVEG
jgi:hypothetical protein